MCKHRIDDYKKIRKIDDNFDGHAAGVRCASPDGAHLWLHVKPLDAAIGWVPAPHHPGGRHGRQTRSKTQNNDKTQLLASDYRTFLLKNRVTFGTRNGPSTQHIEATSCVKLWDATIGAEELVDISSYQTLTADKKTKGYWPWTKLVKNLAHTSIAWGNVFGGLICDGEALDYAIVSIADLPCFPVILANLWFDTWFPRFCFT